MFEVNPNLTAKVIDVLDSTIIEIQNFYKDPDQVREFAVKSKQYTSTDNPDLLAYAVGRRVCEDTLELGYQVRDTFEQLCQHPKWNIKFDKTHHDYYWSGMRFIVNVANNLEIVNRDKRIPIQHVDAEYLKWACVVFLNKPDECEGGTGFYSYDYSAREVVLEHLSEMEYNKLVLYPANMPHGAIMEKNMFKDCDRLVQVMFM